MKVVIKVIDKSKFEPKDIQRIMNQVLVLQKLDHPNIVRYYETYNDYKYIYLVMEYIQGQSLFDFITQPGESLDEKKVCRYFKQIALAINHCHKLNLIHRDLKPGGFRVTTQHKAVKVLDFGLSVFGENTENSVGLGYYNDYMAPELG